MFSGIYEVTPEFDISYFSHFTTFKRKSELQVTVNFSRNSLELISVKFNRKIIYDLSLFTYDLDKNYNYWQHVTCGFCRVYNSFLKDMFFNTSLCITYN